MESFELNFDLLLIIKQNLLTIIIKHKLNRVFIKLSLNNATCYHPNPFS